MAASFNEPPLMDAIASQNGMLSDIWRQFLSTNYNSIIGYLTQYGMLLPQITTTVRNSIINPPLGMIIYNTTTNEVQAYIGP